MITLKSPSDPSWSRIILEDLRGFLGDHALCERKASATALSLIHKYPDRVEMHGVLADLAVEELDHFRQVLEKLRERGWAAPREAPDDYARGLQKLVRHGREIDTLCDRLLVAGLIEARSLERLKMAADALASVDPELAAWYRQLARAESRHQALFVTLARDVAGEEAANRRLDEMLTAEARLVADLPVTSRVH